MTSSTEKLFDLSNRTIVVMGAAGLIGRVFAEKLAQAGARVFAADLDVDRCESLFNDIENITCVSVNITETDSVERAIDDVRRDSDRIDGLVTAAAANDHFAAGNAVELGKPENYPLPDWRRMMRANIDGTWIPAQIVGRQMLKQNSGSIVTVASTYGVVSPDPTLYRDKDGVQRFSKAPAYSTSKGAVLALTRQLAATWGNAGVRVNALSPGGVYAGQEKWFVDNYDSRTPLGRMATPEDYVGALVFLLSDASAYMTGANLIVDGGWTLC